MINGFDEAQNAVRGSMDNAMKALDAASKRWQALAIEAADYSKKSFEDSSAAVEKLLSARSFDTAVEIQTTYFRTAYDAFVSEATKFAQLSVDLTRDIVRPFETAFAPAK